MTCPTKEFSDRDENENENERGEGHISGTIRVDFHLFLQEHSELQAGA
jgi:3-mercaptopyruvate sulfurtransferase SseA